MSKFNWHTDADDVWEAPEPETKTAVSRRRPWITYLIIVVAIFVAGAVVYRQVNQRVEAGLDNATTDILASHNLVQQATLENDADLFITLLSGRSKTWSDLQTEGVEEGWLYDRNWLGLRWLPPGEVEPITLADVESGSDGVLLEIDPELQSAELAFTQAYVVSVGNGLTETMALQHTAVYRRGSQRWLLSPPDTDFWGEYATIRGQILSLAYPGRDQEIAEKLAFDLDAKLNEMCRVLPRLECFDELRIHLRLDNNPRSLSELSKTDFRQEFGLRLELPAPTLVGLPLDEAGYQALYRGYAIQLVRAVIAELTGYECCAHQAFFEGLLAYQLNELGLRPFPDDQIDYVRVVRESIDVTDLNVAWRVEDGLDSEIGWQVMTAIDYIRAETTGATPADLQRYLNGRRSIPDWLITTFQATGMPGNDEFSEESWQQYAFDQYQAQLEPPPVPLPDQDLFLLCLPSQGVPYSELHQYQMAEDAWVQYPLEISALSLSPLPGGAAFLLQDFGDEELRTSLWQDGADQMLFENETVTFGQFDPTGKYLLVYGLALDVPAINHVDWAACAAGDCALEALAGNPTWSPDGTDFIMTVPESLGQEPFFVNGRTILFNPSRASETWALYRGNGRSPTDPIDSFAPIGAGFAPFWLDESTVGFIRQDPLASDRRQRELVIKRDTDDAPRSILTETDLWEALPDDVDLSHPVLSRPSLRYAVPHPDLPDQLFITAVVQDQIIAIFMFNLSDNQLQFLLSTGIDGNHSLSFSPDGRFLIVTGSNDWVQTFSERADDIHVYDLTTGQKQTFAGIPQVFAPSNTYDWSADGNWLALVQQNELVTLAAPAFGYQQFIRHDLDECTNIIWMNN